MHEALSPTSEPMWCIAANVLIERPYGPGGIEIRRGTKLFAPGAKVHVVHAFGGMGYVNLTVVGRHRKTHRYIELSMPTKHLANWRAELVYSPYVIRHVVMHGTMNTDNSGHLWAENEFASEKARLSLEVLLGVFDRLGGANQPFDTRPLNT